MNKNEAIAARHSVRSYIDRPLELDVINELERLIDESNTISGLNIQLVINEPDAFGKSFFAHYGKFSGVSNYLAMIGPKSKTLDRDIGYYGEDIVLSAQAMGLNTCWVGLSYKAVPSAFQLRPGDKLVCLIALGYGAEQGKQHKSKPFEKVSETGKSEAPDWFVKGVEAALLAPTAINQQKFVFALQPDGEATVKSKWGPYSQVDFGIVRRHFEIASGKNCYYI